MASRLFVLLFATSLLAACTKPKDLQFIDIQHVRMINLGLGESTVGLDVRFYNPNRQQVRLKEASAKVYANETYIGDTRMDSVVAVPRRDTFAVPLILKIPTLSAVSKLMQGIGDSGVLIRVDGSVKMGKAGVFLNYPVHYEHRQKLSDLKL